MRARTPAKALREYDGDAGALRQRAAEEVAAPRRNAASRASARARPNAIQIVNAREHNLKNVDVDIPRDKFSVITGVSGSGKIDARLRHPVQRGAAALPRSLNAYARSIRAAGRPARRRCGLRHPADGGDRAAH